MGRFVFTLFDEDRSGTIEASEFAELVRILHGEGEGEMLGLESMWQALQALKRMGEVTVHQLIKVNRAYPLLLQPAYDIQDRIRKKIMGRRFWYRKIKLFNEVRRELRKAAQARLDFELFGDSRALRQARKAAAKRGLIEEDAGGGGGGGLGVAGAAGGWV